MIPDHKVVDAIKHFARTGEIKDQIVPFFDQNGRWFGNRRNWLKSTSKIATVVMHQVALSESRRTGINGRGEPILMTSFVWKKRRAVVVPWYEVRGSIRIKSLESIVADNLHSVGGDFYSDTDAKVSLPNLRRVGGNFDFQATVRLHAPALAEVGGSLLIVECQLPKIEIVGNRLWGAWTGSLQLPNLRSVGGSMEIEGAECIIAPTLEWVGFDLTLSDFAIQFLAGRLKAVGGSLCAGSAKIFRAPKLEYVGDSLYTGLAPDYYRPDFEELVYWEMHPEAKLRWELRQSVRRAVRSQQSIEI